MIEIEKTGPDVHVYYTLGGERLLLREKKGFVTPLNGEGGEEEWWIGAMVCGPLSEGTEGKVTSASLSCWTRIALTRHSYDAGTIAIDDTAQSSPCHTFEPLHPALCERVSDYRSP